MNQLVCGRCGAFLPPGSTYCPNDRWTLFADASSAAAPGSSPLDFELPEVGTGFLARRRQEGQRDNIERDYRADLEKRVADLEAQLEKDAGNPRLLRALGLLATLEGQLERANGLLERAHSLWKRDSPDNTGDFETQINYAIVLARRAQLQPALALLQEAAQKWPGAPLAHFNLAVVALRARRPALVYEAVGQLEALWKDNEVIAQEFHDDALGVRGLAYLHEERHAEALRDLSQAARHSLAGENELGEVTQTTLEGSASADGLNNLAIAEAQTGQVDRAIARLKAALRLEPGHMAVLNNLGVLAYRQSRLDVARQYLTVTLQIEEALDKAQPTTLNHLGVVYSARGELEQSMDMFRRAGGLEHAEFEVFYNLGRAYIEHGKLDVGAAALKQAFSIEPNNSDVHVVLGAAYLFSGKLNFYGEALKHLKRAVQLNPQHRTAAINLVLALLEIRNRDAAQGLMAQLYKLFPHDAEVNYLAALFRIDGASDSDEKALAEATERFEAALRARSDATASLYNSALCQFLLGFRDQSAKLLEKVVARDPSIGPAYALIGWGHAIAKRDQEALEAWKLAIRYEPNAGDVLANIGALLYRKGDYDGAVKFYMNAHRVLPGDAGILSALGVAFAQIKKYQQALTALEQSIQLDPRSPITHSNIGLTFYLFKQVERAVEHWRVVSQLDQAYAERRGDDIQKSFDDSVIQMRSFNWQDRIIRLAPVLPRPGTRLVPGTALREGRLAVTDSSLLPVFEARREVERASHQLALMNLKL